MSRYNSDNTTAATSDNNDYDDDITLKLQDYAAVRLVPTGLTANTHDSYGTSLISNYEDGEVLDGVVFRRNDKENTVKVFSAGKFFHLNPEDGLVYENYDDEEETYTGQMSAQDILEAPRVAGFSESFGGTDYYYEPVGVVIEEAGDIAMNPDVDFETTQEPAITLGATSMLTGNKTWVRTFAKKICSAGPDTVEDNGDDPTPRGEPDTNPKYDSHGWLAPEDPELRDDLEGRTVELWITEQTETWADGETTTFKTPQLVDTKTGEFVTIDNTADSEAGDGTTGQQAATDGGTAAATGGQSGELSEPSVDDQGGVLPAGVPDSLDDLVGYFARKNETVSVDEIRSFAQSEVENPDEVDWEAAAAEAESRDE